MAPQKDNKPRVLIVENAISITGSVQSVLRSSVRLRNDFEFIFLLPSRSTAAELLRKNNFPVYEMPMRELSRSFLSILSYLPNLILNAFRFGKFVRRQRIDIIHLNDFYNLIPPLYRMWGGKSRYLCHVRFMPSRYPKVFLRLLMTIHSRAYKIIVVSRAVKNELPATNAVVVIGDSLPLDHTSYTPPASYTLLYPANFTRGKGQQYALDAFARIAAGNPNWKLRFVGGTLGLKKNKEFESELKSRASELGLITRVIWDEFSETISTEYLACALVLNFSESESFSLTCQEALYYGRVVIATDSGGPSEIIDNNVTGLIVPRGNIAKMAEAMQYLMNDSSSRERMARAGMQEVRERFDDGRTIGLLKDAYLSVL